ncbi:MAG: GNAT family N-acetyltransferase [Terracidiphilus sp.]|jgi:aminoglycoside 6'-N-acetyltransferase I
MDARIRLAQEIDTDELVQMMASLWPDAAMDELRLELISALNRESAGSVPSAMLVARGDDDSLIGFLEVGLRSHADGCNTARPVGFVEGWFVKESFRGRGVGTALMRAAEEWARVQGCLEMASDALIDNDGSLKAHEALGFEVVDRCVHLRKDL